MGWDEIQGLEEIQEVCTILEYNPVLPCLGPVLNSRFLIYNFFSH